MYALKVNEVSSLDLVSDTTIQQSTYMVLLLIIDTTDGINMFKVKDITKPISC